MTQQKEKIVRGKSTHTSYRRFSIETDPAPDIKKFPSTFYVRVKKFNLIKMVLKEIFKYGFDFKVALSRPCIYGVFSRPVGGLAPIHDKCVGCLRCTIQYPDVVSIEVNPEFLKMGDDVLSAFDKLTILNEARTGRVPVKGAGYAGPFGGKGWEGIWTDMSEIVRPTRDGIYGREYISTQTDIGHFPASILEGEPEYVSISVPFILDAPPHTPNKKQLYKVFLQVARKVNTMVVVRQEDLGEIAEELENSGAVYSLITASPDKLEEIKGISSQPSLVFAREPAMLMKVKSIFPHAIAGIIAPFYQWQEVVAYTLEHKPVYWFYAESSGNSGGTFIAHHIIELHKFLIEKKKRKEVSIVVSGGINMAEHVPKALLCGANAVVLNVPLWIALQGEFRTEKVYPPEHASVRFPSIPVEWGVRRVTNLINAWRDQLLEVAGAMGIRDTRRMTGEHGRMLFQEELEKDIWQEIPAYREEHQPEPAEIIK